MEWTCTASCAHFFFTLLVCFFFTCLFLLCFLPILRVQLFLFCVSISSCFACVQLFLFCMSGSSWFACPSLPVLRVHLFLFCVSGSSWLTLLLPCFVSISSVSCLSLCYLFCVFLTCFLSSLVKLHFTHSHVSLPNFLSVYCCLVFSFCAYVSPVSCLCFISCFFPFRCCLSLLS